MTDDAAPRIELTQREKDVLLDAAAGLSAKASAARLGRSEFTITAHRRAIVTKLGAPNLIAAVARAIREGLIE